MNKPLCAEAEVLFFDLDGTLIDSHSGITGCMRWTLQQLGLPVPPMDVLCTWIGPALRVTFAPLLNHDVARVEQAVALYLQRFDSHGWQDYRIYAGISELIRACHASGRKLAVVSAKNEPHARRIVQQLPFGACFAEVVGSVADGSRTHKAQLISEALQRMHLQPTQCCMIGDRKMDIEGARAHNMRNIGVLWGFGSRQELLDAGAHTLAENPQMLAQLLGI